MTSSFPLHTKIYQALKYSRDQKLRRRAALFLKALELKNIAQACRQFGTSPQLYHYWWRRFEKAGFEKKALEERSRRPKNSPRRTPDAVVRQVCRLKKAGVSAEKIRLTLEKEKKIIISLPSVYRILIREGLSRKRKKKQGPVGSLLKSRPGTKKEIAAPLPKIPRQIAGRYRVVRSIGSGGGGVVYLVEDTKNEGTRLALKLLEIRKETDPDLVTHLKNEFLALSSLHHPSLARVHDFGMTAKEIFFTSEYIQGRDLLTATHDADLNLIFQWLKQILGALDFLQRKGILHLDLKPTNIMVTHPDEAGEVAVKLIDFGSADCRKAGQAAPGEMMGTPPYVAPEILMEQPATAASDLYSLGMILHQIFFGAFPFEEKDLVLMMKEQIYQEPKRLGGLPPALPDEFGDLLLKMIARDPKDRYSSARDVLEAINRILGEQFSLRSDKAPVGILDESNFIFRPQVSEEILSVLLSPRPQLVVLSGGEGIGKSRVFQRMKDCLQLKGIFPFAVRGADSLLEYLQSDPKPTKAPVLVDWEEEGESLNKILEALDEKKIRALVTTRKTKSHDFFAHHWLELKPLSSEEIFQFFRSEIADFPIEEHDHPLMGLSEGIPRKLEIVLQALQEEGILQWTEQGWQWQKEVEVDFKNLLSSQEARWKERQTRVLEILNLSPLAMSGETLGGILGLPPGPLEEKLSEWVREETLKTKIVKKVSHYWVKEISTPEKESTLEKNWDHLKEELKNLYAKGNFEAGARWADLILSEEVQKGSLPPEILLLVARHYVASGKASRALEILPPLPSDPMDFGLYYEVRARAQFNLGLLEEAEGNLKRSEEEYEKQNQTLGLARVFNLRGSLFKKQSDFPRAETALLIAIQKSKEAGDFYVQGLSQMNLALFYQEQGEYDRAIATFEEASHSADRAGHPLLTARLKQNRVNLFFSMGRAAEAEKTCYELLSLALRNHYTELQASALNFLALLASQRNQKELELHFLNQAVSLLKSRELWFPYIQTLINRAFYFWEQNRFTPAELDAEYGLSLAQRRKIPLLTAWSQLLLGRILRDRPRPDLTQAEELLARAQQGIWKIQNQPLFWEVEFDRGLLAKKKGEREKARELFLSAQNHLKELLLKVPDFVKQSYLRDRKMERIETELADHPITPPP